MNEIPVNDVSSRSPRFSLPLDMSNAEQLGVFLSAVNDPSLRAGLRTRDLPAGPRQILRMIDDPQLRELGSATARRYRDMVAGTATREDVNALGRKVDTYLGETYPEGFEALRSASAELSRRTIPRMGREPRNPVPVDAEGVTAPMAASEPGVGSDAGPGSEPGGSSPGGSSPGGSSPGGSSPGGSSPGQGPGYGPGHGPGGSSPGGSSPGGSSPGGSSPGHGPGSGPGHPPSEEGWLAANIDVMVNGEAGVNVVAWANVAAATEVDVAAFVVAVAAIVLE